MRRFRRKGANRWNDELGGCNWGEPSDVERVTSGDSASAQAVTRVNVEQASKRAMRKPTRLEYGEGCHGWRSERSVHPAVPPG